MCQHDGLDFCLENRRSVRCFTTQAVSRDSIAGLLYTATLAPSASNRQPWHFVVVDHPDLLRKIKAFTPGLGGQPPCILIACLNEKRLPQKHNGVDTSDAIFDVAMAVENILLAAIGENLGTCVIRSYHPSLVKAILGLPDHILPQCMIALGYFEKIPLMPSRRPLSCVCSYNMWEK